MAGRTLSGSSWVLMWYLTFGNWALAHILNQSTNAGIRQWFCGSHFKSCWQHILLHHRNGVCDNVYLSPAPRQTSSTASVGSACLKSNFNNRAMHLVVIHCPISLNTHGRIIVRHYYHAQNQECNKTSFTEFRVLHRWKWVCQSDSRAAVKKSLLWRTTKEKLSS